MMTPGALPAAKRRAAGGGLHTSPRHRFAISSTARTARGTGNCTTVPRAERISTSRISAWAATLMMRTWRNGLRRSSEASATCAPLLSRPACSEVMDTVVIRSIRA